MFVQRILLLLAKLAAFRQRRALSSKFNSDCLLDDGYAKLARTLRQTRSRCVGLKPDLQLKRLRRSEPCSRKGGQSHAGRAPTVCERSNGHGKYASTDNETRHTRSPHPNLPPRTRKGHPRRVPAAAQRPRRDKRGKEQTNRCASFTLTNDPGLTAAGSSHGG